MICDILTPDKNVFSGEVTSVSIPGSEGRFQVLNNHAPIISSIAYGEIKVEGPQGLKESFQVKGGVVEVMKNKITILTELG
jgi:F-type H+-transporting ATPase subunit epsilon